VVSSLKVYGSIATSPISESWDQTKISLVKVGEQDKACCWVKGRKMLKTELEVKTIQKTEIDVEMKIRNF
jgi:hypothetical protein